MRDKIRSSSTKSEDEAVSDPKVDEPLSKEALEEAGLEREGDRLRERKIAQEMEVGLTRYRIGSVQVKNLGIKPQVRSP